MRFIHGLSLLVLVSLIAACGDDDGQGTNNTNDANQNGNVNQNSNVNQNDNANQNNQNAAVCGDGNPEAGEQCDDGTNNSDTAPDACRTDCQAARCGDGVVDTGEACDGTELDGQTCATLDLGTGTVACAGNCAFDTSGCCDAIGSACTTDCASPYTCNNGICLPADRPGCGGFAGAQCPVDFPVCLFFASSDYGPCFTVAEQVCVCSQPDAQTHFPTCN